MIVILKHGVDKEMRQPLIEWLQSQKLGVHISEGDYQTVLGLIGDTSHVDMDLIASLGIVRTPSSPWVIPRSAPATSP